MEVKPGYKKTEVGVIPEGWKAGRVRSLIHTMKSGLSRRLEAQDIGIPVLTSANIQNNRLVVDELKYWYLDDPQGANVADYVLNDGDILLCFINSMAQIGKPCIFRDIGRPVIYTTNIFRIVASLECVSEFAFYCFTSTPFQEALQLVAKPAVNQASFTKPDFFQLWVAIPPLPEQRAIAAALSDVDALLGGLDRLIAKKRDLKQAAMQQLLTGQTRLPGFSGAWEVKRLGDVGSTYGGLTGKTKADFGIGTGRYVTFMNVMTNVVIDCESFEQVRVAPSESQNRVNEGDLLFNGSSETPEEVAMCSFMALDVPNLFLNSFCFGFRRRDEQQTDGLFLAYYLRANPGRELMKSLAQGSTRYNLSKGALLDASIRLPLKAEQTAVAAVLSDIDAELAALEARRDKTRDLKQAMMQELLTGKTRLV